MHDKIPMFEDHIGIELDFEFVFFILPTYPPCTTCTCTITTTLRNLRQINLIKPMRIAQAIFIPIGQPLPPVGHLLGRMYNLLSGAFPIPFQVNANATIQGQVREMQI